MTNDQIEKIKASLDELHADYEDNDRLVWLVAVARAALKVECFNDPDICAGVGFVGLETALTALVEE